MPKKHISSQPKTLKTAIVFLVLVLLLILFSFCLKILSVIQRSVYDPNSHFIVLVSRNANSSLSSVIAYTPESHSLSVGLLQGIKTSAVKKYLAIPIDGYIYSHSDVTTELMHKKDVASAFKQILVNVRTIDSNMSIIDLVRLWWVSIVTHQGDIRYTNIDSSLDQFKSDQVVSSFFSDSTLTTEKLSVEIVNGTRIWGLGTRVARLISNMGGNIVAVTTSDKELENSEINFAERPTYTVKRIQKILDFPLVPTTQKGIADIVIKIGRKNSSSVSD